MELDYELLYFRKLWLLSVLVFAGRSFLPESSRTKGRWNGYKKIKHKLFDVWNWMAAIVFDEPFSK